VMDVMDEKEMHRMRLPFSDIAEAKLVLSDELIHESLKRSEMREAKASH